jgi:dolichyl-phosphate-mannose--protein O-mannosyl transferase
VKRSYLGWILFFAAYLILYGYRLDFPQTLYFDETYHVQTARDYLQMTRLTDTFHPPLGRLLIAMSMLLWGDHALAWRLPSLLFGFAAFTVFYIIVRKGTKSPLIAFFAVFLFFFDGLAFTQSRAAMNNTVLLFLALLSVYFFLKFSLWKEWPKKRSLLLSGLCFGLAWGTKLLAFGSIFVIGFLFVGLLRQERDKKGLWTQFIKYFVLTAFCAYSATFIVMFLIPGYETFAVFKTQIHMIVSNLTQPPENPHASRWWTWPLLLKPIWYYFQEQVYVSLRAHHKINAIVAIGNPAVYWPILIAMSALAYQAWKKKSWLYGFIVLGFLFQWAPFSLFKRQQFFHYFYILMPFAATALAIWLEKLWNKNHLGKTLTMSYLITVAALFAYWYPLLSGMTIDGAYFRNHLWMASWRP